MTVKAPPKRQGQGRGVAKGAAARGSLVYERAKAMAEDPRGEVRLTIASDAAAPPELLYYLSDDDDPKVLAAIAANPTTPLRAAPRLARDKREDVRAVLASKLARQLPQVQGQAQAELRDVAEHALEMLASDQVVRVRAAVASALRDVECAPPKLVAQLSRDIAREVAEPILRSCAMLSDKDLLALMRERPLPWVVRAVAARPSLAPMVADAVIDLCDDGEDGEVTARVLTDNKSLTLSSSSLEKLVARSRIHRSLQKPLAQRQDLPVHLAQAMSDFVEEAVHRVLAERGDFDPVAREAIATAMRRRLDFAKGYSEKDQGADRALKLWRTGQLTEQVIWDALSWGDRDFARTALALLIGTEPEDVQRVLNTKSPKAVTALAWRAGMSMRFARELQAKAAGIPPRQVLNARHGTEFPLSIAEMRWQIEFFDLPL